MKDCGPALSKWMKKKGISGIDDQHSKPATDKVDLGDEQTPDGTYGKDSRKAAKGAKRMENKRV